MHSLCCYVVLENWNPFYPIILICGRAFIQVNEEYMRSLEILSKKLKFIGVDPMVKTSKALKDVQPELEKLRQKAVSKVIYWSFRTVLINGASSDVMHIRYSVAIPHVHTHTLTPIIHNTGLQLQWSKAKSSSQY